MAIERKFVAQNLKEFRIKEFISTNLSRVGLSSIKLQRTPLGDKIMICASRPGLVVGRAGSNIQKLTEMLKTEFHLENPQIEIEEVAQIGLDASIVAEMIVNSLERFGSGRFKGVGHRALQDAIGAGALGVEILISGKVPSQRARTWRFYQGYLKKCGDVAITGVNVAFKTAVTKSGAIGVKVSIMPPTTKLPDQIIVLEPAKATVEEVTDEETKQEMAAVVAGVDETVKESPEKGKSPAKKRSSEKDVSPKKKVPVKKAVKKTVKKDALEKPVESSGKKDELVKKDASNEKPDQKKTGVPKEEHEPHEPVKKEVVERNSKPAEEE